MAAHLKKRVYEEFTRVVQVAPEDSKKLRLSRPSKSASLHLDLSKASNSTDALKNLLSFSRSPVEAESVEGVARILLEHYYKESDSSVRLKISSLLGFLSTTDGFQPDCILDEAINTLSTEKSHQVLAQLFDSLLVIGSQLPESLRGRLVEEACKHLSDSSFGVRIKCLELLGRLGQVDGDLRPLSSDAETGSAVGPVRDVQNIISEYFGDQDPRVRTAALKAMLQLHERGMKIHQIIYDQVCRLLSDDYEQVRSAAVQMLLVLSELYPESIVPIPSSNEEIRLVDDAFGKISHMVSDGSWMVRVQAAKTLGSMLQVSPQFLEQTLDKKLMSDLRRKRTAHERARELFVSGEFSSGRKWADDAPKERLDSTTVSLIPSGACGAFVHGLEDEMFEVRIAAVEALSRLARSSPSFAEKCLDFLVDMFNDEIEEVRLQSIHVLREISTHITLREDQLDTVLAVLEDSSRDIRSALHELLSSTNVSTKECIQLALLELLKNLNKYPGDRTSVWKCLKFLGSRHPTLVSPLVPELLSTHPYFDTPEPDMDDPAYIAVLVLVFNAATSCPTMTALFSDHTCRHYAYLRDSLSHLVPPLRLPGRKQLSVLDSLDSGPGSGPGAGSGSGCALGSGPGPGPGSGPGSGGSGSVESARLFLQQSLSRVEEIQNLEDPGAAELLELTIRDLQRLGELQSELHGAADFCATYLNCQLLLVKALQEKLWNTAIPLCLKQNVTATAAAQQILEESYKLEFLYGGLDLLQVASIHHVRLQVKTLQLLLLVRCRPGLDVLISGCERFLQDLESFQRQFVSELPRLQECFVSHLLEVKPRLLEVKPRLSSCKPLELIKILESNLRGSGLLKLRLPEQVQRASASILEPSGESDHPLRFTSGLVVALELHATLEHVHEPHNTVRVQVVYPDGQSHVIHPKPSDFRRETRTNETRTNETRTNETRTNETRTNETRTNETRTNETRTNETRTNETRTNETRTNETRTRSSRTRMTSQVFLSHSAWTEPSQIEVRLLLAYSSASSCGSSYSSLPPSEASVEGTVPFSKPVRVYIMPKPARR